MNQNILFNDDFLFDQRHQAWRVTAQISGQKVLLYFHCQQLAKLSEIDIDTKYDLEESAEGWFKRNDCESEIIHLHLD